MSELILPENFNADLLEKALINSFGDKSVKVLNFKTKPAVANGDNYTSDVYRVLVDYQIKNSKPEQMSLIVKYILDAESIKDLLTEYKLYIKEKEMYSSILPKLSEMLNENFGPKCLYILDDSSKIFVMEDLKDLGYVVADRQAGLDLESCLLVVKKLAKFHAGSMVLAESQPEIMEEFDFGMIKRNAASGNAVPSLLLDGLKTLIEVAADWSDFEKIVEKLINIQDNIEERALKCVDQECSFKVLNHGDLWTNNFMIKYDSSKKTPVDVIFIDFQMGYYGSMGIDYNYFITLSSNNAVKSNNRDSLLEAYYLSMTQALTDNNYPKAKIPTLENVQDEVANNEFYGLIAAFGVLPLVLMDRNSGVQSGIENLQNENLGNELRRIQFGGKVFQKSIKLVLKRMESIGALE